MKAIPHSQPDKWNEYQHKYINILKSTGLEKTIPRIGIQKTNYKTRDGVI